MTPPVHRAFILPALPTLRDRTPKGSDWTCEVKFDGYRVQLHKAGDDARILSKNGTDFSGRFPRLVSQLKHLPCRDAVIDGEAVVCRPDGTPDFRALHSGSFDPPALVAWCFDLMSHDGADLRALPLVTRRHHLQKLLSKGEHPALRLSETFADPEALLRECDARGLEGIVMKKAGGPYRSGKCDWIKIKTQSWKHANADCAELFRRVVEAS